MTGERVSYQTSLVAKQSRPALSTPIRGLTIARAHVRAVAGGGAGLMSEDRGCSHQIGMGRARSGPPASGELKSTLQAAGHGRATTGRCAPELGVHPEVVGKERGFLIRSGPEGRGTWGVFRGAGPERFPL